MKHFLLSADYHQCVPYSDVDGKCPVTPVTPFGSIGSPKSPHFDPVVGANGQCYPRCNIETLQASDPAVFNMFILALESLMSTPENQDISWFKIAGNAKRSTTLN